MESDITETGITESVITSIFESGIGYNRKMESTIMESGITESDITKKGILHNLCYESGNRYNT